MEEIFNNDWQDLLGPEVEEPYYQELHRLLLEECQNYPVCPAMGDIFNALQTTSYQDVKVVILDQDPYRGKGQAHGTVFNVQKGVPIPPSLQNIYRELESNLGIPVARTGCLISRAQQEVLLLNTTLTVRQGSPASHKDVGWKIFTDVILSLSNKKDQALVYILWGAHARSKKKPLSSPKHLILEAPYPSLLSAYRGFFGSKPFSKDNEFSEANQLNPIGWAIRE